MREVLLQSHLSLRAFGVFLPPAFLKDEPQAVYKTAIRHTQFLHRLRVISVSGLHHTLLHKTIKTDADIQPTLHQHLLNIKETSTEVGKLATFLFASIEASNLKEKTGKWYFITTDEKYKSAVMFIDHQLIDIYKQAGFDTLEQTRRSPFHRGPHRLSKLSEAAAQHAQHLQAQQVQGIFPTSHRPPLTRASVKLTYTTKNFPPLPSRHSKTREGTNKNTSSTEVISAKQSTTPSIPQEFQDRLTKLEQTMIDQQREIQNINKTLTEQQQVMDRLTKMVETQQQTIEQLKDAVLKLTTTATHLEQITTKVFHQHSTNKPSPEYDQPGKCLKFRTDDNSPQSTRRPILDDPMEDDGHWESQTPNMSQPHSRSPSPSL